MKSHFFTSLLQAGMIALFYTKLSRVLQVDPMMDTDTDVEKRTGEDPTQTRELQYQVNFVTCHLNSQRPAIFCLNTCNHSFSYYSIIQR